MISRAAPVFLSLLACGIPASLTLAARMHLLDPHELRLTSGARIDYGDPRHAGPFLLSLPAEEGNYRVAVEIAAHDPPQPVTIKSESRRLALEAYTPSPGGSPVPEFIVNVRTPRLDAGGSVMLNPREHGAFHWDDRLQLEFHGPAGAFLAVELTPAPELPTVFIIGDSTVTDQPEEPWTGWGQMLPRFFGPTVAIANHAESGMSLRRFRDQRRLQKVLEQVRRGDYLFIQFGHNDQKETGEGVGPWTSFSDDLRDFVSLARDTGAQPVLVTPVTRRRFDAAGRQFSTHGDYPLAVRRVAAECRVPLIDLHLMSSVLFGAMGPHDSRAAFVHYPAGSFPGQEEPFQDDSHFNAYGGYQLARCVVEGIRLALPGLARHIATDARPFDPARPDPVDAVRVPASPRFSEFQPEGD